MAKTFNKAKLTKPELQAFAIIPSIIMISVILLTSFLWMKCGPNATKRLPALTHANHQSAPSNPKLSTGSLFIIEQMIAQREYHISYDKEKQSLQSPNRKQNLRAYYKPGMFTIQNRIDSVGHHFQLNLKTGGIFADGQQIYAPQKDAITESNENSVQIKHPGFTEEYINNEQGIRQNFIIQNAPDDTKELQVRLAVEGLALSGSNANELYFSDERTAQLIYKDLHCWDADHRPLPATLSYANDEIQLSVDVRNAVYPITIDPLVLNGTPVNANTLLESNQIGAAFGASVSSAGDVNGDGYSDIVVGAPYYDNGFYDNGAAFVFHGSADALGNVPAVVLEGNATDLNLGYAVSSAGDINRDGYSDLIAGAPGYSNVQQQEGAVFVYYGSQYGLNSAPSIILESNVVKAGLGSSVASAADVNSDGYSDIIIGAAYYSNGQGNEGAFYIYHGSPGGINNSPALIQESNIVNGSMGKSVAGAGDVNADGYSDIVVGTPYYGNGQAEEGAAMIYFGSAAGVKLNSVVVLENNQADAQMGWSVSSAGDVNGDGYCDVIIGAPRYDGGLTDEGAALVYHGSSTGIAVNPATILEVNQIKANIGLSVACAGDVNGDGYSDVIIGGRNSAHVFQGSSAGINQVPVSTITNGQADASMGRSVASAGDINGDGYSDILVGADTYNHGEQNEGIVLIFHGGAYSMSASEVAAINGSSNDGQLGWSLSSAGDVNGDGYDDVVMGAPNEAKGEPLEGIVYVYYGSPSGVNLANPVVLQINVAGAHFGLSVSSAGDVNGDGYADVIVGAEKFASGQLEEGSFYLFLGSPGGLATSPIQSFEGNQQYARLGSSVSSAGDLNGDGYGDVVVGARGYSNKQDFEGALMIYYGSATGVKVTPTIIETNQNNGLLGAVVANAGDVNGDGYGDIIASVAEIEGMDIAGAMAAIIFHGSATGINKKYHTVITSDFPAGSTSFATKLAGAGDVNGDGFSDIIIGADNENGGDGVARVYHGSLNGVSTSAATTIYGERQFGWDVSSAGDVNGDGYSDVMVVSRYWENGEPNEGAAFVFHGSTEGIKAYAISKVQTNQPNAGMWAVSDAGDVNGDGFGDVIVGSIGFDVGANANAGKVFVCQGNNGGGLRNSLRLYNNNSLSTNINHDNVKEPGFGFGLFGKPFLGRGNVKILWETKKEGEAFSHLLISPNAPIANSTEFTDIEPYGQISNGTESKYNTSKLGKATKIRARFKYDPTRALTGQVYSPWRYLSSYTSGNIFNQSSALPVNLTFFTAQSLEDKVRLDWQTAFESNSDYFEIEHSGDGKTWRQIGNVKAASESNVQKNYSFDHHEPQKGSNFYRLKMVDRDGTFALSRIRNVDFGERDGYVFYPNPVSDWLHINEAERAGLKRITIFNSSASVLLDLSESQIQALPEHGINFQKFPSGVYIVNATHRDNMISTTKVVKK